MSNFQQGILWDMHTHLANTEYLALKELKYRRSQGTAAFFSSGTPQEWEMLQKVLKEDTADHFLCSFGIHPWYSDVYEPECCRNYFELCDAVGEIGMDDVWCEVPLQRQKKVLEAQLQIASDLHKPIILHTKGQERAIAEMIRNFPEKICVHWYSGEKTDLERYLEKDCYFTLGPDFGRERSGELYQYMMRNIPVDRLFLETDGLEAILWMMGEDSSAANAVRNEAEETALYMDRLHFIPEILKDNLNYLAECKKKKPEELLVQMQKNLSDFLG